MIRSPAGYDGMDRIKRYQDYYQASYGVMMLSSGQFGAGTAAGYLLGSEPNGLAVDFTASSADMLVRDSTGALNYSGNPFTQYGGKINFSRASSATRVNSSGLIETVVTDVPRIDYDPVTLSAKGLLVEGGITNYVLQSNDFSTTWTKTNVVDAPNAIISPEGTLTGDGMLASTTTSTLKRFSQVITVVNATVYTQSVYVKAGLATTLNFRFDAANSASFDLSAKTAAISGSFFTRAAILDAGNGWYRCDATFTSTSTSYTLWFGPSAVNTTYASTVNPILYLWGAQLELGPFSTSLVPTLTTAVARSPDIVPLSVNQFPYSASEGTLVAAGDFVGFNAAKRPTFVSMTDGIATASPSTSWVNISQDTSNIVASRRSSSTTATNITASNAQTVNVVRKVGLAFKQSGTDALSVNGAAVTTQPGVAAAYTNDTLKIGAFDTASSPSITDPFYLNGHVRQITYLPRQVSNAEIETRTA